MPETFDLIVRGGEVVNHAGRGLADVGVRDGKIVAVGDLRQASAGEVFDATGLTVLPGVIDTQVHFREPGLEWKEDLETGSRAAVLGGVVAVFEMPNTEPHHHRRRRPGRQAGARRAAACTATTPSTSAAPTRTPHFLGELERLPGCCGVKVFMGASTGTLLVADDDGRRARCCATSTAAPPSIPRTNTAWPSAGRWPAPATGPATPRCATPSSAIQSTERLVRLARALGKRIHVLHVTTAEEIDFLADHKDVATVEVTPQHLTLAGARGLRAAEGLRPDEPADPRRRAPARACGGASPQGVADVLGSDHAPHTRRRRPGPIRPRRRACRACRPWCR